MRPRFSVWGICALAVGLLAGSLSADQPRPFLFSMGRYTAAWAGRPQSYDIQIWDHMVTIGVTLTGSGLAWVDAEPTQGQYNWDIINRVDFEVDQIRARGMECTFFVGLTPKWAALYPSLPAHRTPPAEQYAQQFMDFHRFVANRYKGKVKYYFFWNEPNGCSWINDGCSNGDSYPLYTNWLIRCSQAMKQADPNARIIAGNLDYHSGVARGYEYIQGMYDNGAGPHIDGIAIHPYDSGGTIHWRAVNDTRRVMVDNGDGNKGIWINEFGWSTTDYQSTADKLVQVLTELKKPQWSFVVMANYLVLNDGPGVENYGLMDKNLNPRAGYYAFRDFDKSFPVDVDFSADVTLGLAPLTVQFTDLSPGPGITGWAWEFGDGQTSSERNPQHTYQSPGTYTVRLTIQSPGGPASLTRSDFITVRSPHVGFSADVTAGPAPLTVKFTDESLVAAPNSWLWEFGDGQTSTSINPTHVYALEGTFTVRLTVTGSGGSLTAEKAGFIHVGNISRVAFLNGSTVPSSSDAGIVEHLRGMGLIVDPYDDEPDYRPSASIIAATHELVIASSTVVSANVAGQFRDEPVPFIHWESGLSLKDREALADGAGLVNDATKINVVDNQHPIMAGMPLGPLVVTSSPTPLSRSTGPIAPGAQVLATDPADPLKRMVIVAEPGAMLLDGRPAASRRIFLFLYDTTWPITTSPAKKIFENAVIYALGPPAAEFSADRARGIAPLAVRFTDESTGPVTGWHWDFGDETTSTLRHPAHTYAQPGTYDVRLTVDGPGGQTATLVCSACIHVIPRTPGDFDGDGDVDQSDFGHLQECYSGPGVETTDPLCLNARLDGDADVDLDDFDILQACLSGEGLASPAGCGGRP